MELNNIYSIKLGTKMKYLYFFFSAIIKTILMFIIYFFSGFVKKNKKRWAKG